MRKTKQQKKPNITLAKWLIDRTDTDSYRAGILEGWKHPKVDGALMELVGGRDRFLEQARSLENETVAGRTGRLRFDWREVNTSIRQIHYDVAIIPALCELENIEDPRQHQLKMISNVKKRREEVKDCEWLCAYYDDILTKLEKGNEKTQAEDDLRFQCLNAIARQEEPVWERVFSARVLNDSKLFRNEYRDRVVTVLMNYSPYYIDGMNDDEILDAHEIHSYAQTVEWKGPLQYRLDGQVPIDTSCNYYGTVLNTQTMEHAVAYALPGCRRIMTIENKANYESMCYAEDTLYIFCHGFFTPKEVRFLRRICDIVPPECEFYHWGDMDFGGISIFQFIKGQVFPKVMPYKMGADDFQKAVEAGAGIPLKADTRAKLEGKDAGLLTELKDMILKTDLTIEQERLL